MQQIDHWPDKAKLTLPKELSQDLQQKLLQPFASETEAKQFWEETSTTLIILDPTDNIAQLKESDAWNQIDFALTYPEYTVPLNMDYTLSVTITNDSGGAIFLLIPPELSHIIQEANP